MPSTRLKAKFHFLITLPIILSCVTISTILYFCELYGILLINVVIFGFAISLSHVAIQKLFDEWSSHAFKVSQDAETIDYTLDLLNKELLRMKSESHHTSGISKFRTRLEHLHETFESHEEIYTHLRSLLRLCHQEARKDRPEEKALLNITKELAKLCSESSLWTSRFKEELDLTSSHLELVNGKMEELNDEVSLLLLDNMISRSRSLNLKMSNHQKKLKEGEIFEFRPGALRKAIKRAA